MVRAVPESSKESSYVVWFGTMPSGPCTLSVLTVGVQHAAYGSPGLHPVGVQLQRVGNFTVGTSSRSGTLVVTANVATAATATACKNEEDVFIPAERRAALALKPQSATYRGLQLGPRFY